jgi:hypothetical protein
MRHSARRALTADFPPQPRTLTSLYSESGELSAIRIGRRAAPIAGIGLNAHLGLNARNYHPRSAIYMIIIIADLYVIFATALPSERYLITFRS